MHAPDLYACVRVQTHCYSDAMLQHDLDVLVGHDLDAALTEMSREHGARIHASNSSPFHAHMPLLCPQAASLPQNTDLTTS